MHSNRFSFPLFFLSNSRIHTRSQMKRKICTMEVDCQTRIDVLKSIIGRIQLAKDSMDFGKLPGLKKEYEDTRAS